MRWSIDLMPPRHGRLCVVKGNQRFTTRTLIETLDAAKHSRLWKRRPVLFASHPEISGDYGEHNPLITTSAQEIFYGLNEQTGIVVIDGAALFPKQEEDGLISLIDAIVRSNRLVVAAGIPSYSNLSDQNLASLLALSDEVRFPRLSGEAMNRAYAGCMFSMKSRSWREDLKEAIKESDLEEVIVFKYMHDLRGGQKKGDKFSMGQVTFHNGCNNGEYTGSINATMVSSVDDVIEYVSTLDKKPKYIFIDEGQFLGDLTKLKQLSDKGIRTRVNGLLRGYNRKAFGQMGDYLVMADSIMYNNATCTTCGSPARESQRLEFIDQETDRTIAAHIDGPLEVIGGAKNNSRAPFYEARCLDHWQLRGEKTNEFTLTRYKP